MICLHSSIGRATDSKPGDVGPIPAGDTNKTKETI